MLKLPFSGVFSRFFQKILPKKKEPPRTKERIPTLRVLFFIIEWTRTETLSAIFDKEHVMLHFITRGRGTATSEIHDLLGIGATDKGVVLCLEEADRAPLLISEFRRTLKQNTLGAGIAFTIPLSGIHTPLLQLFKEERPGSSQAAPLPLMEGLEELLLPGHKHGAPGTEKEKGEGKMAEIKNDLIVSIINQGYSDEFMKIAREAGARGGTVISARGLAHEGPVKFFGVSVQDEKEIILILASRDKKAAIMQAVSRSYGITSKAGGVIFSLPADLVTSLSAPEQG